MSGTLCVFHPVIIRKPSANPVLWDCIIYSKGLRKTIKDLKEL